MMRERLAELEVIRSGGHSPGLEAQRTQSGIEAHQHSTMPLTTAGSTAYMEGRQLHESTLQVPKTNGPDSELIPVETILFF